MKEQNERINEKLIETGVVDWVWIPRLPFASATVYVSAVLISFDSAPTTAGDVSLGYAFEADPRFDGTFKSASAVGKDSVLLEFNSILPLHHDRNLRVNYANPDNRRVAITVFFTYMN